MPKPITMTIDVEEIRFGKIWRTLDAMDGVVAIHLKGNGPKQKKAKTNGKGHGATIPTLILEALERGTMTMSALEEVIESHGKMKSSLPSTLVRMKRIKQITKVGEGYKITAKGRKARATTQE